MSIKTRPTGQDFAGRMRWDDPARLVPASTDGVRWYRDVQYALIPGYRPLLLDVAVPEGVESPPVAVVIHGGGWMSGSEKMPSNDNSELRNLWPRLIEAGIAVAFLQYRLSREATFPAQLHDVKAAVRWLRLAAPVLSLDGGRIAAVGESAGGHLALLLGNNVTDDAVEGEVGVGGSASDVMAVVAWYPVTRFSTLVQEAAATEGGLDRSGPDAPEAVLIGAPLGERPDLVEAASPISYVSEATAPTLLIHGTNDRLVSFAQSVAYRDALAEAGVPVELILVEGAAHVFYECDPEPLLDATTDFLRAAFEHRGGA